MSVVFPPLWLVIKVISQASSHQWIFIRHSTVTSDFTCINFVLIFLNLNQEAPVGHVDVPWGGL